MDHGPKQPATGLRNGPISAIAGRRGSLGTEGWVGLEDQETIGIKSPRRAGAARDSPATAEPLGSGHGPAAMRTAELISQCRLDNGGGVVAPGGVCANRRCLRSPDGPMALVAWAEGMANFMQNCIADIGLIIQQRELTAEADRPLGPAADSEPEFGPGVPGEPPACLGQPVLFERLAGQGCGGSQLHGDIYLPANRRY